MKKKIIDYRNEIDIIDLSILKLIENRCEAVRLIGEMKNENSLPVYVPSRENQIFSELIKHKKILSEENIKAIFTEIISSCRALEKKIKVLSYKIQNDAVIPKIFGNAIDIFKVFNIKSLENIFNNYDYIVIENSDFKNNNFFILNFKVISIVIIFEIEYYIIKLNLEEL